MALGAPFEKDKEGRRLVLSLSRRNKAGEYLVEITPEIWQRVSLYNRIDVDGVFFIDRELGPLPGRERDVWELDQRINRRALQFDLALVHGARGLRSQLMEEMLADFHRLTNLGISPTQRDKLLHWLVENGVELKDLRKGTIDRTLKKPLSDDIRRILKIRKEFVASSLAKLDKVLVQSDKAGRARGLLQYHGARTGRWTGRGIQPQNLPRPLIKVKSFEIEALVAEIKSGDRKALEARGDPIDVLVSSLRHIVVARDGALLAVGDFSMIEACILLALAGQRDKCELIRAGKDPYRDMGVLLYGLAGDVRDVFLSADRRIRRTRPAQREAHALIGGWCRLEYHPVGTGSDGTRT
jgi:DNA polymerase